MKVKIALAKGARHPVYASHGAAGCDLHARLEEPMTIASGGVALVPTGVFLEILEGFEAQVRPRSGLAAKHGVTLLNAPGTIDSDYRGEIKVIMINHGREPFTVKDGERIAQLVFAKVERAEFEEKELTETKRGSCGFGSTGR